MESLGKRGEREDDYGAEENSTKRQRVEEGDQEEEEDEYDEETAKRIYEELMLQEQA